MSAYARSTLPTYSLDDVTRHNSEEAGYWISFKHGVYDITNFVKKHPGGPKYIELVAGGRLEPFWAIFKDHSRDLDVLKLLESMRIGNLRACDQMGEKDMLELVINNDAFDDEPTRDVNFAPMHEYPFVGEVSNELLGDNLHTPNKLFYIRNHFPVPTTTSQEHKLYIHLSGYVLYIFNLPLLFVFLYCVLVS